jgi:hypothetical protein
LQGQADVAEDSLDGDLIGHEAEDADALPAAGADDREEIEL